MTRLKELVLFSVGLLVGWFACTVTGGDDLGKARLQNVMDRKVIETQADEIKVLNEQLATSSEVNQAWVDKMAKVEKRMRSAEDELALRLAANIVIPEPDPIPQWQVMPAVAAIRGALGRWGVMKP